MSNQSSYFSAVESTILNEVSRLNRSWTSRSVKILKIKNRMCYFTCIFALLTQTHYFLSMSIQFANKIFGILSWKLFGKNFFNKKKEFTLICIFIFSYLDQEFENVYNYDKSDFFYNISPYLVWAHRVSKLNKNIM